MRFINGESGHFYTPNGEPCHTIIGENGKVRNTTVRDAKHLGLLPSVTAITKMFPADNLRNWMRMQDVLAAATTPRWPEDTDDDWVGRVLAAADETAEVARVIGSRRHDLLHRFHKDATIIHDGPGGDYPFLEPYLNWLGKHVGRIEEAEYVTVHRALGYAGTVDMRCLLTDGRRALIDVKNRKRVAVYHTDAIQLVAYAQAERQSGVGIDAVISVVLGTEKPELFVTEWLGVDDFWEDFKTCLRLYQRSKNYTPKVAA